MKKFDLVLQLMTALVSIFLGVFSFISFQYEMYIEIPLILTAILFAVASAKFAGVKTYFLAWVILISVITVLISKQKLFDYTNPYDPGYYFHIALVGLIFWGGINLAGFIFIWWKRKGKESRHISIKKILIGELEKDEFCVGAKFYTLGEEKQLKYLGGLVYSQDKWRITTYGAVIEFSPRKKEILSAILEKVEKLYPNGKKENS